MIFLKYGEDWGFPSVFYNLLTFSTFNHSQEHLLTFEWEALQSLQRLVRCDRRALDVALASLAASARLAMAPRAWAWAAKALTNGTKAFPAAATGSDRDDRDRFWCTSDFHDLWIFMGKHWGWFTNTPCKDGGLIFCALRSSNIQHIIDDWQAWIYPKKGRFNNEKRGCNHSFPTRDVTNIKLGTSSGQNSSKTWGFRDEFCRWVRPNMGMGTPVERQFCNLRQTRVVWLQRWNMWGKSGSTRENMSWVWI